MDKPNASHRVQPLAMSVRFTCFSYDPWSIVVAGNIPELGNWEPRAALPMRLQSDEGGRREWVASLSLPAGREIEFKFVANSGMGPLWEVGDNRRFTPGPGTDEMKAEFRK